MLMGIGGYLSELIGIGKNDLVLRNIREAKQPGIDLGKQRGCNRVDSKAGNELFHKL